MGLFIRSTIEFGLSSFFLLSLSIPLLTQATHPLIRTSQVSLSSNPDSDFRYSNIFTPIGIYKGQLYAIKKVKKKYVDITREMKMELKLVSGPGCGWEICYTEFIS